MAIVRKIGINEYVEKSGEQIARIWPIDAYEIPAKIKALASEYHVLKVPLLGQHCLYAGGAIKTGTSDWCGRTSSSMAFNWFELMKGGDPKERYISHWHGGTPGNYLELRHTSGYRAFHLNRNGEPLKKNDDRGGQYLVQGESNAEYPANGELPVPPSLRFPEVENGKFTGLLGTLQYKRGFLYPYPSEEPLQKKRFEDARAIAQSSELIDEKFKTVLASLRANNPVVLFSGVSGSPNSTDGAIHIILLVGYFYIPENGRDNLWILVANPATLGQLIGQNLATPIDKSKDNDLHALAQLGPQHDMIRIDGGDWYGARASLSLMRARHFFDPQTMSDVPYDLMLDYWTGPKDHSAKGGLFFYSDRLTDAPPELVDTTLGGATVAFPFDDAVEAPSPVRYLFLNETSTKGGYYPLGLHQNIHAGVHLEPIAPPGPLAPVRALGPGYVVAARLAAGLPSSIAAGDPAGAVQNTELAKEIAGGSNAFVLLRHELAEILPKDASGDPKKFTFYSLAMHLATPNWSNASLAKQFAAVPWLDALVRRRNGSILIADPSLGDGGKVCMPVKPVTAKTMSGGKIEAFGATFAEKVEFSLGPTEPGRTTAVCRAEDPDVKEALDALASGKVLTFTRPSLKVGRGEILGYVPGEGGFLHWEIFAPAEAEGGLEKMLGFAAEKLGLGADFFKAFKEKTENNFLDPEDEELATLLDMLPGDDGDKKGKLDTEYAPAALVALMTTPDKLVFATEKPAGVTPKPGELSYPLTIEIEDFRKSMPAGERTLTMKFDPDTFPPRQVKFDPKKGKVDVMVPAGARKIILESADFFLELGSQVTTPAEDAAHFKRIASARLRKATVEHLNTWSKDGLVKEMLVRFANKEAELEPYAKAVAFWANDEEAVLGEDGKEEPLFAASAGPGQLPEKTKLAHAHPIIVTWLVGLLLKHGFAKLVADFPPVVGSEAAEKLLYLGWMPSYAPAPKRRVGDVVHAVAVAAGEIAGSKEIVLQAKLAGADKPFVITKGRYAAGFLHAPVSCPFWGDATLELPEQTAEIAETSLSVLAPSLGDAGAPEKNKQTGIYTWSLQFSANRPSLIHGFVVMKYWIVEAGKVPEGEGTDAPMVIPIEAMPPKPVESLLEYDPTGHFIVAAKPTKKVKDPKVSASFAFSEYQKVFAGGSFKLSKALAERIEKVRGAYAVAQKKKGITSAGTKIVSLAESGLSARITSSSKDANYFKRFVEAAEGLAAEFTKVEKSETDVLLEVAAPLATDAGPVLTTFDPGAAFGKLLADNTLGPKEEMHIRFGVIFQNGGRLVRASGADSPGAGMVAVDAATLRGEASEVLEAWAPTATAKLRKPQFGPITKAIGGKTLTLSAELFGASADWLKAKPMIVFTDKKGNEVKIGKAKANLLTATIDLDDKRVAGANITFKAKVTNAAAVFDGEKISVSEVSFDYDTTPKLGKPAVTFTTADMEVRCEAHAFPTNRVLEIEVFKVGLAGEENTGLRTVASFANPYSDVKYQGFPNGQGAVLARIGRKALAKKAAAGDKLKIVVQRPKNNEKVLDVTIEAENTEETVPEA
jgi:hypothetical protein